ncbi:MAG: hypothetical protein ABJI96_04120 [Paracoccaceae bacterium]
MELNLLHSILTIGTIGLGLYLFGHPVVLRNQSKLVRGVVIWVVLVIVLHVLDYAFLS